MTPAARALSAEGDAHLAHRVARGEEAALRQMMQVHNQGKSVLTRESMERAEHYVHQLQRYSLNATMERDE